MPEDKTKKRGKPAPRMNGGKKKKKKEPKKQAPYRKPYSGHTMVAKRNKK